MQRRFGLLVVLVMLAVSIPITGSAAPIKAHPVRVAATSEPWVDSGIALTAGEWLEITATGSARTAPPSVFPGARSGPDGQAVMCPDAGGPVEGCALDGEPYGALLGKVGSTVFVIGGAFSGVVPENGTLELAINDNLTYSYDNSGGYTVHVNR